MEQFNGVAAFNYSLQLRSKHCWLGTVGTTCNAIGSPHPHDRVEFGWAL